MRRDGVLHLLATLSSDINLALPEVRQQRDKDYRKAGHHTVPALEEKSAKLLTSTHIFKVSRKNIFQHSCCIRQRDNAHIQQSLRLQCNCMVFDYQRMETFNGA